MSTAKRDQILQEAEKLAARGKLDAAIKEYRRALEQAPHDTNTLNKLGDLLVRANQIPGAIDVYTKIAEHFAEDGFFLKSIAIFKKVNRLDPQRTEIYERLADLYFKQGLVVEGRQQLLALADWFMRSKNQREAVRVFRRLAELEPSNFQARAKLVEMLVQLGDVDGVSAEIDGLGRALIGRGLLDDAVKLYRRALELAPPNCDFLAPCIDALVATGRMPQAIELAKRATADKGKAGPNLQRAVAAAYAQSGDLRNARTMLEGLIPEAGDRTDIIQLYGDVLLRVGEAEQAKEHVIPTVDRLIAARDLGRAGALLKRLLKSTPDDIDVLERAMRAFDRREDPELVQGVQAALAESYFRAERKQDAIRVYRELAQHDPDNRVYTERLTALGATPAPAPKPATPPPAARPAPPAAAAPPASAVTRSVPAATTAAPAPSMPPNERPRIAPPPPPPSQPTDFELEFVDVDIPAAPPAESAPRTDSIRAMPIARVDATAVHEAVPPATNAEELYTESVVFAKYGLTDKAIAHLHRLLAMDPLHARGRELLASLGGGHLEEVQPAKAPAMPSVEPAFQPPVMSFDFEVPSPAAAPPPAEARPTSRSSVGPVRLADLEAILGLGEPTSRPAQSSAAPPPSVAPGPAAELEWGASSAVPEPVEIGAGASPPEDEAEVLEEPVEFVEVGEVLAGPNEEQLHEIDFFIQQGLLDEASGLLDKLREQFGSHADIQARQALLKARGWEDARPSAAAAPEAAASLFSEEEQFFDLAAELEKELAEEDMVAEARGAPQASEASIEELFHEFQKGVAEQINAEDFDTHFNLGLAYREMGLLDEAIGEFQLSAKSPEMFVESASMIAACYIDKGLPEQSAAWYERALTAPALASETEAGLHYELASALELVGNTTGALQHFTAVLATMPGFRDVVERVSRLKAN